MEHYDTIIIGAGLAGCAIAHSLKKINYKGEVLIIDKNEIGSHEGYGYKMVFEHERKKYNLPYKKKYEGVCLGSYDTIYGYAESDFRFLNYKEICEFLIEKSDAQIKKEKAISLAKNKLTTNKTTYHFDYLIDCSGYANFVRKQIGLPISGTYWLGETEILEGETGLDQNKYYSFFGDGGFYEDIYPFGNKVFHGHWQYTNNLNFENIIVPEKTGGKKYLSHLKTISKQKAVIPCSPLYPITYKNIAWLGDSFGSALTHSATGIYKSLESSEILAKAIKYNNLEYYEKTWRKQNNKTYLQYLAFRLIRFKNGTLKENSPDLKDFPKMDKIMKILSKYPQIFIKRYQHAKIQKIPKEIQNYFTLKEKLIMLKKQLELNKIYKRKIAYV